MNKDVTKKIVVGIALVLVLVIFIPSVNSQFSTIFSVSLEQKEHIKNSSRESGNNLDKNSVYDSKLKTEESTNTLPLETENWWDYSWSYRKNITIDHTKVDDDFINFPVLISLSSDDDLASKAQDNGNDIVFTDYSGNKLNHEIELFNGSTGELVAWVNVTSLSSTMDKTLYMYYGNPSAANQENPSGVWDSSYKLVQHLNETSGTHYDSTVFDNDGTPQNGVNQDAVGKVDGADEFDGIDDYVRISDHNSLEGMDNLTIEAWVNLPVNPSGEDVIATKWSNSVTHDTWLLSVNGADRHVIGAWHLEGYNTWGTAGYNNLETTGSIPLNTWTYVTYVKNSTHVSLYINGIQDTSTTVANAPFISSDVDVSIGAEVRVTGDPIRYFNGAIDEVRISNTVRNSNWLITSYNNQNDPNTFYSVGDEEPSSEDTTPPTTTHKLNPPTPNGDNGWYVSAVKITFNATDNDSGVAWTNYSSNNGVTWTTHTGPWPFDVIVGEGKHQLLYYSEDNAGNVESVNGPFALRVDTTTPEKQFFSFSGVFGPIFIAIVNIGLVRDGCSGLDRVEFYLNDEFHHQMDLSGWPAEVQRVVLWIYYNPGVGDSCSGIVYDIAGNSKEMEPQTVPQFIDNIKNKQR